MRTKITLSLRVTETDIKYILFLSIYIIYIYLLINFIYGHSYIHWNSFVQSVIRYGDGDLSTKKCQRQKQEKRIDFQTIKTTLAKFIYNGRQKENQKT